ncbi:ABC transporter permease subunit [Pseudokineococcus basanitobsidens]|uniref:ABC transporter permease subunit n=1 Tax=Pseudokineococcus basanitobsidens TaxID=1926649 RepID=A0ABU8RI56_9ACTN
MSTTTTSTSAQQAPRHADRGVRAPAVLAEMVRWDVRQRWRLSVGVGVGLAVVAVMVFALYPAIGDSFAGLAEELPEGVANLLGGAAVSSLAGWVNLEVVSIVGPFALLLLGGALGAAWLAGAEESGTSAVLLSTPATRRQVVLAALLAGLPLVVLVSALELVGFVVGDALVDEGDIGLAAMVATHVHLAAIGVFGLALALAVGAVVARRVVALAVVGLVGVLSFLIDGFAPTVDSLEWLTNLSAFSWAIGHDPLATGLDVVGLLVLLGASAVLVVVALVAHDRRDLTV